MNNYMLNQDLMYSGIYRAYVIKRNDYRVYLPGLMNNNNVLNFDGSLNETDYDKTQQILPKALFNSIALQNLVDNEPIPCWVVFENGNMQRPIVMGYLGKGVKSVGGGNSVSTNYSGSIDYTSGIIPDIINDGLTIADIQKCANKKAYLELVLPIYKEYCKNYKLKYPGVLALQPFYEVGAGFPQKLSNVAIKDNNLGGLKYSPYIPGATRGTNTPSNEWTTNENSKYYSHFDSVSAYYRAHVWQIGGGDYYSAARANQSSVINFTRTLLNSWVLGNINQVPSGPVSYSEGIISDYNYYGLSQYEN